MNLMKFFSIALFVLLVSSCQQESATTPTDNADKTLEVDLDRARTDFKLSEIVDTTYFVPLETHEDCLIGSIGKIIFHDSLIVVLDSPVKGPGSVYLFNQRGKFVRTVGSIGRGPGEYGLGTDMELVDGRIQVLDNSRRIFTYGLDGTFIGRKRFGFTAFNFIFHDRNYHFAGGIPRTNTLFTTSKEFKEIDSYFPHQNYWLNKINLHPFWVVDDFVFYARPYDNTVYNLSEGNPKPFLFVDYLDKAISYGEVSKKGFDFELSTPNYAFTKFILENDNFMMVVANYQDRPYVTLVDKLHEKQLTYSHIQIEHDLTGENRSYPIAVRDDDYFVYNVDPSSLFGKTAKRDARLDKILETANEFSNPILMMVKFKL